MFLVPATHWNKDLSLKSIDVGEASPDFKLGFVMVAGEFGGEDGVITVVLQRLRHPGHWHVPWH